MSRVVLASKKTSRAIASTDSTMLNYSRDAYAYCWPRDGAFAMWPLIQLGYVEEPRAFFRFIARVIHSGGYVMHKYFSDGSLGPSWHPYVHGTSASAPIQEDETAIVLFMLAEFVRQRWGVCGFPDPVGTLERPPKLDALLPGHGTLSESHALGLCNCTN